VPATGEGISLSTLSVATSSNGSSTSTRSPGAFNHLVMVASSMLSPSDGSTTAVPVLSCVSTLWVLRWFRR